MSDLSFSMARKAPISFQAVDPTKGYAKPYDKLTYMRCISNREKPTHAVYSIDLRKIHDRLDRNELHDLEKITVGCNSFYGNFALWDVLFNEYNRSGMGGCIFLAKANYAPIGRNDTVQQSFYLNYAAPVSRVELNNVSVGNRVGISIHSIRSKKTYVLLYRVNSFCVIPVNNDSGNVLVNGINCDLEQIYVINAKGSADVVDAREDVLTNEFSEAFVQHLVNSARDIESAFAWKPHFRPARVAKFDREVLEARLAEEIEAAPLVSYDVFETAIREVYQGMKPDRNTPKPPAPEGGKKGKFVPPAVPIIEVVSLGVQQIFVKIMAENDGLPQVFKMNTGEFSDVTRITESFLTYKDLEGKLVEENGNVMRLNSITFGENAIVRYLTCHF